MTAKSHEMAYFWCFPRTTAWLLPLILWVRIFPCFTTITGLGRSHSGLLPLKGSRHLPFGRKLEEPSARARVGCLSHLLTGFFPSLMAVPAQIQKEVTHVLMGMGAPTQELANFTGLRPAPACGLPDLKLNPLCLSTAWLMPQPQARKPFSQG